MRQRSTITSQIDVTDMLILAYEYDEQPLLVVLEGIAFLPIFSTIEKLEEQLPVMRPAGPTKIKQIDDGHEFLMSVLPHVRVMLDPFVVDGKTRFTEVRFEESS